MRSTSILKALVPAVAALACAAGPARADHQIAPETTIPGAPTATATKRPAFLFASDISPTTFSCRFAASAAQAWTDADAFACATATSAGTPVGWQPANDLADGEHVLQVRGCRSWHQGTVVACDQTPAVASFRIDTVAPSLTFDATSTPDGARVKTAPTYKLNASETVALQQCSIDGAQFGFCPNPYTTPSLTQGEHTIAVRAWDAVNNLGTPVSRKVVWDTIAPVTAVPAIGTVTTARPSIAYSAVDADDQLTATCALVGPLGENEVPCGATSFQPAGDLTDGDYTLKVGHTDRAGNASAVVSRPFTVKRAATGGGGVTPGGGGGGLVSGGGTKQQTGGTQQQQQNGGTQQQQTGNQQQQTGSQNGSTSNGTKKPGAKKKAKCKKPRGKAARSKKARAKYERCVAAKKRAAKKTRKA